MPDIDVSAHSPAPPEDVWAVLADTTTWPRWTDFDEAEVESGSGSGEIRRLRTGRRTTRERVTTFEPPHRLGYELVSGVPVKDYRAEVTLSAGSAGGTDIRWRASFQTKIPGLGFIVQRKLEEFVQHTADGLARGAAERTAV